MVRRPRSYRHLRRKRKEKKKKKGGLKGFLTVQVETGKKTEISPHTPPGLRRREREEGRGKRGEERPTFVYAGHRAMVGKKGGKGEMGKGEL